MEMKLRHWRRIRYENLCSAWIIPSIYLFHFRAANLQNKSFAWWLRIDRIGIARCLWSPYECIVVGDCVDDKKCERLLQHIRSIVQREIRTHVTIPDGNLDDVGVRIPRTYHLHKRIFESNRTKLLQSIDGKCPFGLVSMQLIHFSISQVTKFNFTYRNVNFQTSLDNMIFDRCTFQNCTFRRIYTNHVLFNNSLLENTEFASVKTSRTSFINSKLNEMKSVRLFCAWETENWLIYHISLCRFIDTEVSSRNFIDCVLKNTRIIRLNGSCDMDFDYNIFASSTWKSNLGGLIPCILAILSVGEAIQRLGRATVSSCCFTISMILCVILAFVTKDEIVIWIGGCAQGFILAAITALTVFIVETYTTSVRWDPMAILHHFDCAELWLPFSTGLLR